MLPMTAANFVGTPGDGACESIGEEAAKLGERRCDAVILVGVHGDGACEPV
jgi:hypothetical protein